MLGSTRSCVWSTPQNGCPPQEDPKAPYCLCNIMYKNQCNCFHHVTLDVITALTAIGDGNDWHVAGHLTHHICGVAVGLILTLVCLRLCSKGMHMIAVKQFSKLPSGQQPLGSHFANLMLAYLQLASSSRSVTLTVYSICSQKLCHSRNITMQAP